MLAIITGIVRHAMTFGGGFLVTKDLTTMIEWETAIGAVITLVGIGWSIYEKMKAK